MVRPDKLFMFLRSDCARPRGLKCGFSHRPNLLFKLPGSELSRGRQKKQDLKPLRVSDSAAQHRKHRKYPAAALEPLCKEALKMRRRHKPRVQGVGAGICCEKRAGPVGVIGSYFFLLGARSGPGVFPAARRRSTAEQEECNTASFEARKAVPSGKISVHLIKRKPRCRNDRIP